MPAVVVNWIETVRQKLKLATQSKPQPPSNLARTAITSCRCVYCEQLSSFLSNSELSQIEIKAAENYRYHMEEKIRSQSLDLKSEKIRIGSRYALRFTKTTDSFRRLLKRYEDDLKLLASVE